MTRRRGGAGGPRDAGRSGPADRGLKVRVKTAKKRTGSSTRWLERQLNDPYVAEAKRRGYRSRAAFKLVEMDDRFHFLRKGMRVIDLGCAPGGWCQVAVERVGTGRVVGVDLSPVEPIAGVMLIEGDFLADETLRQIEAALAGEGLDVVLSDMAAPSTGHRQTDHLKIMALCEAAVDFAARHLKEGGSFCAKVLRGGTENALLSELKRVFSSVRHVKPNASRSDSAEAYLLAMGFRGEPHD